MVIVIVSCIRCVYLCNNAAIMRLSRAVASCGVGKLNVFISPWLVAMMDAKQLEH